MVCKIMEAVKKVDVIVTTGSVSMGDRDMLKPILQTYFKATIHFGTSAFFYLSRFKDFLVRINQKYLFLGRVNMKPGKPTTFATCMWHGRKKYFLCLPGNPVSATVTARLFLLPLLNEMRGDFSESIVIQAKVCEIIFIFCETEMHDAYYYACICSS